MEIVVRGRNVQVPPELSARTRTKVTRLARVTRDSARVEVEFSELRNPRIAENQVCAMTVHLREGRVRAHAQAAAPMAALDRVLDKADHQVTRAKARRAERRHGGR
jgi:ribosomal subunit interface protein